MKMLENVCLNAHMGIAIGFFIIAVPVVVIIIKFKIIIYLFFRKEEKRSNSCYNSTNTCLSGPSKCWVCLVNWENSPTDSQFGQLPSCSLKIILTMQLTGLTYFDHF
jgi:hypothetical protein